MERLALMCFEALIIDAKADPGRNQLSTYILAARVRGFFPRQIYARMLLADVNGKA